MHWTTLLIYILWYYISRAVSIFLMPILVAECGIFILLSRRERGREREREEERGGRAGERGRERERGREERERERGGGTRERGKEHVDIQV